MKPILIGLTAGFMATIAILSLAVFILSYLGVQS